MRTALLNPTVWLLASVFASAAWGVVRRQPGHVALGRVVRTATRTPILVLLAVAAAGSLASRVVVGYLAPGAYAEEVLAARAFLSERQVYGGDERREFARWLRDEPVAHDPWTLPGVSACQASAFEHRPQFFTSQAHSPFLLLASVPVVRVIGGRGLYGVIVALSIVALVAAWRLLAQAMSIDPRSRTGLLAAVALAGWQPIIAGLRQGDAVVLAAGLIVAAWCAASDDARPARAGVLTGLAAALALPAVSGLIAFARWPRALAAAMSTAFVAGAVTVAVGGPMILADFVDNVGATAAAYAALMPNYALGGRLAGSGAVSWAAVIAGATVAAIVSWWRSRSMGRAAAAFSVLGLLAAPVAWSQHLSLALAPLVILSVRAAGARHSAWLAAWAVLALALSLPDPAVAILSEALQPHRGVAWPLVPIAIAILWLSLGVVSDPRSARVQDGVPVLS